MRSKEEANDYRYFPDPDLLPVIIDETYIADIKKTLPELPNAKQQRFIETYNLKVSDAQILTTTKQLADFYEAVEKIANTESQISANWVIGDYTAALNRDDLEIKDAKLSAADLAGLLNKTSILINIDNKAKEVFEAMWDGEGSAEEIIESKGLVQITDDSEIETIIDQVIENNPSQLAEYLSGKDRLFGFFVGQVMKETKGKANPQKVNEILKNKLT